MSAPPPGSPQPDEHRSPPPPSTAPERALAEAIVHRAHAFTLPALLDALLALGLRAEEVIFRSGPSHSHRSFLIHGVEFLSSPRRAVVTLNIGLLAAQSPLPTYFFSLIESGEYDADAILAVLSLIDHPLLRERARSEYPERDRRTWNDWEQTKGLLLRLMALPSPSSLHWLFRRVFPELPVQIERIADAHPLSTEQVVIGKTGLGESRALGGRVELTTGALAVTLYCEEATSPAGRSWTTEAAARLERHVLPLLQEQPLFLHIWLEFADRDAVARLSSSARAPDSFLGYDPLGRPASPSAPAHPRLVTSAPQRVLLFNQRTDLHT